MTAEELLERYTRGERNFARVRLPGADLAGAVLCNTDLVEADLSGANLSGADLSGSDVRRGVLRGAVLTRANLRSTAFHFADLRRANLTRADLSGAVLTAAGLGRADLTVAVLRGTDLGGANLRSAILRRADLRSARIRDADLCCADLTSADLTGVDFSRAFLRSTVLIDAKLDGAFVVDAFLRSADLTGADLTNAVLRSTVISDAVLTNVYLDSTYLVDLWLGAFSRADVAHGGPSHVEFRSVVRSFNEPRLKEFLRATGMPDVFVEYMVDCAQSLDPEAIFSLLQSTFLSYGSPDKAFAWKLNQALEAEGVTTFYFEDDAPPGEKLHRMMRKGVNEHDRVILVCSRNSLDRPSLLNELEETLQREGRDGGASYLIPVRLDDYVFNGWKPHREDLAQAVRDRVIADFREHQNAEAFRAEVAKLIRVLKKPQAVSKP